MGTCARPGGRRIPRRRPRGPSPPAAPRGDRKSTRLNSSHTVISYAVFCLKKKKKSKPTTIKYSAEIKLAITTAVEASGNEFDPRNWYPPHTHTAIAATNRERTHPHT